MSNRPLTVGGSGGSATAGAGITAGSDSLSGSLSGGGVFCFPSGWFRSLSSSPPSIMRPASIAPPTASPPSARLFPNPSLFTPAINAGIIFDASLITNPPTTLISFTANRPRLFPNNKYAASNAGHVFFKKLPIASSFPWLSGSLIQSTIF